jgi:hypothetical protein
MTPRPSCALYGHREVFQLVGSFCTLGYASSGGDDTDSYEVVTTQTATHLDPHTLLRQPPFKLGVVSFISNMGVWIRVRRSYHGHLCCGSMFEWHSTFKAGEAAVSEGNGEKTDDECVGMAADGE